MTTKAKNEMTEKTTVFNDGGHQRQHKYVEELKKKGDASFSLVATETFVEGMRDSGYNPRAPR